MSRRSLAAAVVLVTLLFATPGRAAGEFRFPEAKHGKGELRYIDHVPVLTVRGSPQEIGEQVGVLALKPAEELLKLRDEFLKEEGWETIFPIVVKVGYIMLPQFPGDHVKELDAVAKVSGWPRDLLIFGNVIPDLRQLAHCSTLVIEPARSSTGGILFGRNLDWGNPIPPPHTPLYAFSLVTVYRPTGKHAFASIGFPGMLGLFSGMNDAGLAVATLDVFESSDGSPPVDPAGVPFTLALRRVLEECTTIEEAERMLRSMKRTVRENFAFCDLRHGAVLESTSRHVIVRRAVEGVCACTNSFRTKELEPVGTDFRNPRLGNNRRFEILDTSRSLNRLSLSDVARKMDAVADGLTLQTMIFEPANLKLHVAFGQGPATKLPLRTLDLAKLFVER